MILQGTDIKKLQADLAEVIKSGAEQPLSITQSQSAIPVVGSRLGWENVITITIVFHND